MTLVLRGSLIGCAAALMSAYAAASAHAAYDLSTFVDMSPGSTFAQSFCPDVAGVRTCAPEGSLRGRDGNLYVAMALPKGKIMQITPGGAASIYATFPLNNADPSAFDFNSVNLRLVQDRAGNLYTTFISVDNTFTLVPSIYNGVWLIPPGGGSCDLASSPCTKLWPPSNQAVTPTFRFGAGIALDRKGLKRKGSIYVADARMGNIVKINMTSGSAALWAGVDAHSAPNYLGGNPGNFILGGPEGRGIGVFALAIDRKGKNLYASNSDRGSVVRIPINKDGSAGTQVELFNVSDEDGQLEALYLDPTSRVLHVTRGIQKFSAFLASLQCFPTCALVPFEYGHRVYAGFVGKGTGSVTFDTLIDDPILGETSSIAPGTRHDFDMLYLDVLSSTDGTGPKILRAEPLP